MVDNVGARARLLQRTLNIVFSAFALALTTLPSFAGNWDNFGPFGPEGPRMREQLWILPGATPDIPLRATVFRPSDGEAAKGPLRRPLVVINHGTSDDTRLSVSMPVYYWLSRWFVERGYVVVLPQRRGHGSTGGKLAESIGDCANPDHFRSGQVAADDVESVVEFMSRQTFVQPKSTIVAGISTGGWASLALASRNPANVAAIVNFAGGRGGHARGRLNAVCGESRLVEAAATYGRTARIPSVWLYAENDTFFGPTLASEMATAWKSAGAPVQLSVLPPYRDEGHEIANDQAGWNLWGPVLDKFLLELRTPHTAVASGAENPVVAPTAFVKSDAR